MCKCAVLCPEWADLGSAAQYWHICIACLCHKGGEVNGCSHNFYRLKWSKIAHTHFNSVQSLECLLLLWSPLLKTQFLPFVNSNLSASKLANRQAMRNCKGLIDSLMRYTENCVNAETSDNPVNVWWFITWEFCVTGFVLNLWKLQAWYASSYFPKLGLFRVKYSAFWH